MQVVEEQGTSLEKSLGDASALLIPGWNGSGAGHWQTLWEQKYSRFHRVEQHNWDADLTQRLDCANRWGHRACTVADVSGGAQPGVRGRGALGCNSW